jgi:hypothetical protein
VNRKRIVASVLAKARKYRDLTRMIGDRETAQRILELTEELSFRMPQQVRAGIIPAVTSGNRPTLRLVRASECGIKGADLRPDFNWPKKQNRKATGERRPLGTVLRPD